MNRKRLFRELDFFQIIKGDTDFGISVQNGKISKDRIQSGYSSGALSINTKRGSTGCMCPRRKTGRSGNRLFLFGRGEEKAAAPLPQRGVFSEPALVSTAPGNLIVISTKCGEG